MWVSRETYERLLKDHAAQVAQCVNILEQIESLKDRIAEIAGERDRERKRADNAIDELLAVRGIGPVTPPTPQAQPKPRDFFAEDPAEVQRIHERLKADGLMETLLTEVTT